MHKERSLLNLNQSKENGNDGKTRYSIFTECRIILCTIILSSKMQISGCELNTI
jgi:hypothetical protein